MTNNEAINHLLLTLAYSYEKLTPGEPIDDAYDLLVPGDDEDPIIDNIRKALWTIDGFDLDEASATLTEMSESLIYQGAPVWGNDA